MMEEHSPPTASDVQVKKETVPSNPPCDENEVLANLIKLERSPKAEAEVNHSATTDATEPLPLTTPTQLVATDRASSPTRASEPETVLDPNAPADKYAATSASVDQVAASSAGSDDKSAIASAITATAASDGKSTIAAATAAIRGQVAATDTPATATDTPATATDTPATAAPATATDTPATATAASDGQPVDDKSTIAAAIAAIRGQVAATATPATAATATAPSAAATISTAATTAPRAIAPAPLPKNTTARRVVDPVVRRKSTSTFQGVSWDKSEKIYTLTLDGKFLGRFPNQVQAAIAYDEAVVKAHGKNAVLNFPDRDKIVVPVKRSTTSRAAPRSEETTLVIMAAKTRKIGSGYKGVSWDRSMNAWRTKINSIHVGYFDDETEAARAYDEAAVSVRGRGAVGLNFSRDKYFDPEYQRNSWMKYNTKFGAHAKGTSSFRGVIWDKNLTAWRCKIKHNCKTLYLGVYEDEPTAARAYDLAARRFHGSRAKLNFPRDRVVDWEAPELLTMPIEEQPEVFIKKLKRFFKTFSRSAPDGLPTPAEPRMLSEEREAAESLISTAAIVTKMTQTQKVQARLKRGAELKAKLTMQQKRAETGIPESERRGSASGSSPPPADMTDPRPDMAGPRPDMGGPRPDMGGPRPDMAGPRPDMTDPRPDMANPSFDYSHPPYPGYHGVPPPPSGPNGPPLPGYPPGPQHRGEYESHPPPGYHRGYPPGYAYPPYHAPPYGYPPDHRYPVPQTCYSTYERFPPPMERSLPPMARIQEFGDPLPTVFSKRHRTSSEHTDEEAPFRLDASTGVRASPTKNGTPNSTPPIGPPSGPPSGPPTHYPRDPRDPYHGVRYYGRPPPYYPPPSRPYYPPEHPSFYPPADGYYNNRYNPYIYDRDALPQSSKRRPDNQMNDSSASSRARKKKKSAPRSASQESCESQNSSKSGNAPKPREKHQGSDEGHSFNANKETQSGER